MMNKEKALNVLSDVIEDVFNWYDGDISPSKAREYEVMEQFIYKYLADGEEMNDSAPLTLEDHIQSVFDKYTNFDGNLAPSVSDVGLDTALEEAFAAHPDECKQFSVYMEKTFENPGYITGYISFSWIDHLGLLNHETAQWEVI